LVIGASIFRKGVSIVFRPQDAHALLNFLLHPKTDNGDPVAMDKPGALSSFLLAPFSKVGFHFFFF
jgi:hypothetical protein